ncbi:putative receptor-like protein kinase At3g47110 [Coffea eugenioides]|uniref:putative receptor-like protein kinase At3g47110 n=1 Tax=Coffea eugenioides TaxID=49369 RepID=UPI000F60627B|nr:putative receptor-like protein kinase At3g47110 [Coffea eugenioides]
MSPRNLRVVNLPVNMDRTCLVFHLVVILCLLRTSIARTKNITTDQSALRALKSHVTFDPSDVLSRSWINQIPVCNWTGVKCSSLHQRVVALNISHLGLQGNIPPQVANLSFLNSIDISGNDFQGNLPEELVHLQRLSYINFSFNKFSGGVPSWLGFLPNLQYLYLANNSFTGILPSSLFNASKLEDMRITYNQLEGIIAEEIGNLGNLKILDLQNNELMGSIPRNLFNISSLQVISLSDNSLSGTLPMNICTKLPKLQGIYLPRNLLSGQIHSRFKNCTELQILSLSINNFSGQIPREVGNLTMLSVLSCGYNMFEGPVPAEIGNLQKLQALDFTTNFLSGPIPKSLFNMSTLTSISFTLNNLSGSIPPNIGQQLPNLEELLLGVNKLSGVILDSISNLTKLSQLELGQNQFTGSIPTSLGSLRFLEYLSILQNHFTSDSPSEFSFLTSLTNCRNLRVLSISENPLSGELPPTIGNFSSSFQNFYATLCGIKGNIPHEIGNLSSLLLLNLDNNSLTGPLPDTLKGLSNLQGLDLQDNRISGSIPNHLCTLRHLAIVQLSRNQFSGQTELHIPSKPWKAERLVIFRDQLKIPPEVGNLKAALAIALAENEFSGNIPTTLGGLQNLISLSLAHNELQGPIPETFSNLLSLQLLDLSNNNLTGEIPTSLESLLQLKHFNVSFNELQGRIPLNGSFANFTYESFMSNKALCGGPPSLHFPPCTVHSRRGSKKKRLRLVVYTLIPSALMIILITILLAILKKRSKRANISGVELFPTIMHERVSYRELQQATNDFSESNLIAMGGYGSVYKGVLEDGAPFAVKVFNLQLEGGFKSFDTECEVLRNLRHRNLVKVISSCSNPDFKALILEYMPNGSLEEWLYSHDCFLDFLQRLDIMIDVASALDYLHHGYSSPVVHCDLKPSNVLLDEDMTGHLGDFGISKLLGGGEITAQTKTLATIGYIAPEYGFEGVVSTRCDLYSFGILLMETFTRKRPTDEMFGEDCGLKDWVMDALQNSANHFIDSNLITVTDENSNKKVQCALSVMELALRCSAESPEQRIDARGALNELRKIKVVFLAD